MAKNFVDKVKSNTKYFEKEAVQVKKNFFYVKEMTLFQRNPTMMTILNCKNLVQIQFMLATFHQKLQMKHYLIFFHIVAQLKNVWLFQMQFNQLNLQL